MSAARQSHVRHCGYCLGCAAGRQLQRGPGSHGAPWCCHTGVAVASDTPEGAGC